MPWIAAQALVHPGVAEVGCRCVLVGQLVCRLAREVHNIVFLMVIEDVNCKFGSFGELAKPSSCQQACVPAVCNWKKQLPLRPVAASWPLRGDRADISRPGQR
jgi:hypothetical protein